MPKKPTRSEVIRYEQRLGRKQQKNDADRTLFMFVAVVAAVADAEERGLGKGHGGLGEIQCPVCGGIIHYSVSSTNGHTMGRCTAEDCVKWIQ